MGQLNIFGEMYETFKFDKNKPIKLFEAFAGYGSQQMALKRLGLEIDVVGYSEIDKYAIQVYEALHGKHKNYGVAQNRERVFIVSTLGKYSYEFPKPFKLEKRLRDYLEDEADEKYYLSDKMISTFMDKGTGKYPRRERFIQNITKNNDIANTVITTEGSKPTWNFVIKTWNDETKAYKTREDDMPRHRIYDTDSVGFTITTAESQQPSIINNLRIRKLTPREALRLMDVEENDIDTILNEVSNTQAYKLAGNSIVVNVLVEIFKQLF